MLDVIPNLITSVISILFPIFASYKALRTSDPAQLTPWLMYWVVFSCFSLAESWTWFVLVWLPFYSYLRLVCLAYLVLPQSQGARIIYQSYIDPFLAHHESDIDVFISDAHERAKAAGFQYLKRAVDFIKEKVFGIPVKQQSSPQRGGTYSQNLLSRFNLPSARQGLAAPAGDFYGLLSAGIGQMASHGGSRDAQINDMSRGEGLIPEGISSNAEKATFLATQRERLQMLLSALDKQATDISKEQAIERDIDMRLGVPADSVEHEGLMKSRSEAEFDSIGKEEATSSGADTQPNKGGWFWGWGGKSTTS